MGWAGMTYELGELLAETDRFPLDSEMALADVDVDRLALKRVGTAGARGGSD